MKVLYYTSPPFLDIAIEKINILKSQVELHVLIETTPNDSNRLAIYKLPAKTITAGVHDLIPSEFFQHLEDYFHGCKSANLILHNSKSGLSFSTLMASFRTWRYIKKLRPDIIHFEVASLRSLGLIPFLFDSNKICITIHDPVPHSNENSLKSRLAKLLFLKTPFKRTYFFYSDFSRILFENHNKKDVYPKVVLRMYPYSIYKRFLNKTARQKSHILFFGSINPYKGVINLLKTIPMVLDVFEDEMFIIAGRKKENYLIDETLIDRCRGWVRIIDRYIPNEDLSLLIEKAKFVVCPYLDATQSGVLMTSFAFNTPVIATDVGAFPEYIEQGVTGLIIPVNDPVKLAEAIIMALRNNLYENMSKNLELKNRSNQWVNKVTIQSPRKY